MSEGRWGGATAIETAYAGYRFRSRLEARWAVFFDALGIPWEYEPEGFDLGSGVRYLPDFWLPDQGSDGSWFEVKGKPLSESEKAKALRLAAESKRWVFIGRGDLRPIGMELRDGMPVPIGGLLYATPWGEFDGRYDWLFCERCERFAMGLDGLDCWRCGIGIYDRWTPSPSVVRAYERARSARFEHGEAP